ncbi:hypothetical protein MRX96_017688 [Rhipicephalus microplus]
MSLHTVSAVASPRRTPQVIRNRPSSACREANPQRPYRAPRHAAQPRGRFVQPCTADACAVRVVAVVSEPDRPPTGRAARFPDAPRRSCGTVPGFEVFRWSSPGSRRRLLGFLVYINEAPGQPGAAVFAGVAAESSLASRPVDGGGLGEEEAAAPADTRRETKDPGGDAFVRCCSSVRVCVYVAAVALLSHAAPGFFFLYNHRDACCSCGELIHWLADKWMAVGRAEWRRDGWGAGWESVCFLGTKSGRRKWATGRRPGLSRAGGARPRSLMYFSSQFPTAVRLFNRRPPGSYKLCGLLRK